MTIQGSMEREPFPEPRVKGRDKRQPTDVLLEALSISLIW